MKQKPRKAMHIDTMVSLSIASVAILTTILIGLLTSYFYTDSSRKSALTSTTEIVAQINNNMTYYISDLLNVADYARNAARFTGNITIDEIKKQLETLISSRNDLTRIALFSQNGECIVSTDPAITLHPDEIVSQEWFIKAKNGEGNFYFTGPHTLHLSRTGNDRVITYSSIINYREDIMSKPEKGILLINLNFNAIAEIADNAYLPSSGYIYIITNDGELVYHPKETEIREGTFKEDFEGVEAQVYGAYISSFGGKERITSIEPITQAGWRVVGVAFMDDLRSTQHDFILTMTLVLALILILAIILAQFIAGYISSPIKQLETIMRKVQKGHFNIIPPIEGAAEVQSLSSSFAVMIAKISKLMEDIKKAEALKRQHELDALQAKINPHFLYNTLDSMIWMAETGDKDGVVKMATALASLFRVSIAKGHDIITLQEELFHTKSYLEIQQMRYKDKFDFNIDIPKELENCPTIKLIIQPIVENAIYHGIKLLQEKGKIEIIVREENNDRISITVKDNGVGMSQTLASSLLNPNIKLDNNKSDGNGIGLRNIEERIKLTYGNEYGLKIDSELDEGTTVTITIPHLPDIKAVVIHKRS